MIEVKVGILLSVDELEEGLVECLIYHYNSNVQLQYSFKSTVYCILQNVLLVQVSPLVWH